jgi:hypothetical protein
LAIDIEFFRNFQSLYDVKPKAQADWCVPYFALIHLAGQYLLYKYEAKTLNWKDAK